MLMFMVGPSEVLLLIFFILYIFLFSTLAIIVRLLRKVSRFEKLISKLLKKRFQSYSNIEANTRKNYHETWWLPLPYSILIVAIYILLYVLALNKIFAFSNLCEKLDTFESFFLIAEKAIISGLVFLGLVIHFNPNGNRKIKYEFLFASLGIGLYRFSFKIIKVILGYCAFKTFETHDIILRFFILHGLIYLVFLLIIQFGAVIITGFRQIYRKNKSISIRSRWLNRWVKKHGYIFVLFFLTIPTYLFLLAYLPIRYCLGEKMRLYPILYFRSFQYIEGPTAFGKIVARIASRYGVLLALAQEKQPPLELHALTRLTERAELLIVPDQNWQEIVENQMKRAALIIIDYSMDTRGLTWEVDRALELVDPSKIVILRKKGIDIKSINNVWMLDYQLGEISEKDARKKLNKHMHQLLLKRNK